MNSEKWIEALYDAHAKRISRIAAYILEKYLGYSDDAADVVQEVFLLAARSDIRNHPAPEGWLVVATKNVCSNHIRGAKRAGLRQDKAGEASIPKNVHCVHSYSEPFHDNAGVSDVMLTLKQILTPEEYKLVQAYCIEKQSVDEIAAGLGMTPNAVRVKIFRIREKAKKIFYEL